ncbi:MAG: FAD-binding oxidoreductase, partial [Desulfobacterales bacterium]|nr:FAD-binding oxidoreductase [Desulfobacterales bacterium]
MPWLIRYTLCVNTRNAWQVADELAPLLQNSIDQHRKLADGTGAEKWIHASDYVFVYENRAAFEKDAFAWSLRRDKGFAWDEMDAQVFGDYEPMFAGKNKFAIRLGEHGRVSDPERYVIDLATHVTKQGGELLIGEVEEIVHQQGTLRGVKTANGVIECDKVVVAAGVWSKMLLENLGVRVPMESERGYHIELVNPSAMPAC